MYKTKIIIADDESMTLDSIKFVINKYLPEVEIVAECTNGKDILDFLSKGYADILVMDIRMPIIDGISVLKTLHENSNTIKTVLITAYKNFEYAYEAIQYGCESFLTKPIDYEKLISVIRDICEKMNQQAKSVYEDAARILEKRAQERKILNYYYNRLLTFDEMRKDLAEVDGIDNECAIIHIRSQEKIIRDSSIDICEINNEFLNVYSVCDEDNTIVIFAFSKSKTPLSFKMHIELFLSDICNIIETSYNTKTESSIKWLSSIKDINAPEPEKDIFEIVELGLQYITDFVSERELHQFMYRFSFEECKQIAGQIVEKAASRFNPQFEASAKGLEKVQTKSDVCAFLSSFKNLVQADADYKIFRVRQYIFDNCTNELQLGDVAEIFGYNYFYFSRIFREKNSRGFIEYIVYARIEKAKHMLLSGVKVKKVAETVGYEVNYFKKRFKKETGKTVTEFLGVNDEENI